MTNKSILITGGTGSLGKALTKKILENDPLTRIVIIQEMNKNNLLWLKNFP